MNRRCASLAVIALLCLAPRASRASEPPASAEQATPPPPVAYHPNGDLFPKPWRPSVSAATGLPFFGIAEVGVGVTNGFQIGVVGGGDAKLSRFLLDPTRELDEAGRRTQWMQLQLARR